MAGSKGQLLPCEGRGGGGLHFAYTVVDPWRVARGNYYLVKVEEAGHSGTTYSYFEELGL